MLPDVLSELDDRRTNARPATLVAQSFCAFTYVATGSLVRREGNPRQRSANVEAGEQNVHTTTGSLASMRVYQHGGRTDMCSTE